MNENIHITAEHLRAAQKGLDETLELVRTAGGEWTDIFAQASEVSRHAHIALEAAARQTEFMKNLADRRLIALAV